LGRCQLLREALDNPAITTDIIVGFPGETDEEFAATLRTAEAAGFSKIHIFPFSPRKGTPAAEMPDQVSAQAKAERHERLADLEQRLRRKYFDSLAGRELTVLVEGNAETGSGWAGTSCRYAPVEMETPAECVSPGELIRVQAKNVAPCGTRLRAVLPADVQYGQK
jgi:threonylcarbamoyladenosine tRNA methylthiotransferase MtaB